MLGGSRVDGFIPLLKPFICNGRWRGLEIRTEHASLDEAYKRDDQQEPETSPVSKAIYGSTLAKESPFNSHEDVKMMRHPPLKSPPSRGREREGGTQSSILQQFPFAKERNSCVIVTSLGSRIFKRSSLCFYACRHLARVYPHPRGRAFRDRPAAPYR